MALSKEALAATDENKQEDQKPSAEEVKLPKKMRMASRYAFYDENGRRREWKAGDVIANEDEIKLLVGEHKVQHVVID